MPSGGKRPGAGRKPEGRVGIYLTVAKDTVDRMKILRSHGVRISREFDRMIKELSDNQEK